MRVIGITGPSGSGKTQLTESISSLGIKAINADELYHSMLIPPSKCLDAIRFEFGDSVFKNDGSLDRNALSSIVFNDKQKLELLNKTVLCIVVERIRDIIKSLEQCGEKAVVIDAPTLIESGFYKECDTVISVLSSESERSKRISMRDNISEEKAIERIRAQKDDSFYISNSHIVIYNNGTQEEFSSNIREIIDKLHLFS
ncbi:MAG: dephospho-CoA kinase [Clostridia bacterium]|nr:dephospho-CoA kinase [Clostridia bacterium]